MCILVASSIGFQTMYGFMKRRDLQMEAINKADSWHQRVYKKPSVECAGWRKLIDKVKAEKAAEHAFEKAKKAELRFKEKAAEKAKVAKKAATKAKIAKKAAEKAAEKAKVAMKAAEKAAEKATKKDDKDDNYARR